MTPEGWVAMRPEGIHGCTSHDHPVLLLREVGGTRRVLLQLDEGEARHLAGVFGGTRSARTRVYETLEDAIAGLGGTVLALRLLGDRRRGMRGEVELAGDWCRTAVPASPGDVAALAWRLKIDIQLPSEVTSRESTTCRQWLPSPTSNTTPAPAAAVLAEADPEDYDW